MGVEEKLSDCEYNLKQLNHFNPDPYYVNYFLKEYLQSINEFYDEIFEEATRDFGLFVSGKCTKEKFYNKASKKNDKSALSFLSWFEENFEKEHQGSYPDFIRIINYFYKENKIIPKIFQKLSTVDSYKDDFSYPIKVRLSGRKLISKEELQVEIKRQLPVFLEIINQKRKNHNQPIVVENQVMVSSFLEINSHHVNILEVCEVYIPVMKRILDESRKEIRKLTSFPN